MSAFEKLRDEQNEEQVYLAKRLDNLIFLINGAGIYVILELFKFHIERDEQICVSLKLSGALFVFSIVLNLIALLFSYRSSLTMYNSLRIEAEHREAQKEISKTLIEELKEDNVKFVSLGKRARIFNILSLLFLAIGLILISIHLFNQ